MAALKLLVLITSDWSEKKKGKTQKKEDRGKEATQLYNYNIRGLMTQSDGSIIGLMEKYYVVVHTSKDAQTGATTTTSVYHYDDLIIYKIQPNGTFEWIKRIPKRQYSHNDRGY